LRVNGSMFAAPLAPDAATVAALVRAWLTPSLASAPTAPPDDAAATFGVAVARNGEVVPRSRWATEPIAPGDDIEIAAPFQGG
jgi:thiamine biosynthesis protein ThiS